MILDAEVIGGLMYFRKYKNALLRRELWQFRVQIGGVDYCDKVFATRAQVYYKRYKI